MEKNLKVTSKPVTPITTDAPDRLDGACCRECAFAEVYRDHGVCRRRAPVVQYERTWESRDGPDEARRYLKSADAIWPRVCEDDWCGEFQPRPRVPGAA
jgi:hypothetical protein